MSFYLIQWDIFHMTWTVKEELKKGRYKSNVKIASFFYSVLNEKRIRSTLEKYHEHKLRYETSCS